MKYILKIVKEYLWPLLIGAAILYFLDIKFFLFYLLIMLIFVHEIVLDHFNNSARLYMQVRIDRTLKMIFRHLKVSDKERERILKEAETDMSVDHYELFKDDIKKL